MSRGNGRGGDEEKARKEAIKGCMKVIGDSGRREMLRILTETPTPWVALAQIQNEWGLGFERCRPAILFLDELNQSRSVLFVQIFEHMKTKLDEQLDCIKDEKDLLQMLRETIQFMSIRDLKSIPISIIKRLKQVPDMYLQHLAKKRLLNELPLQIRRQAWELDDKLFAAAIEGPCRDCIASAQTPAGVNRADGNGPVKLLVDYIGHSEILFSVFANYCASKCREEKQPHWGGVIRHVLMRLQDDGQKIQSLAKLNEMAWLFDQSSRGGKGLDVITFLKVVETLKQLVVSQATTEDRNYKRLLDDIAAGHPGSVRQYRQKSGKLVKKLVTRPGKIPLAADLTRVKQQQSKGSMSHLSHFAAPRGPAVASHVLKAALEEAWSFMDIIDKTKLFARPVTEDIAQNYSRVIKRPMDLATMKSRVRLDMYSSLDDFDADVLRIFRNCRKYNGDFSQYTVYATSLNKQWRRKLAELRERILADPMGTGPVQAPTVIPMPVPAPMTHESESDMVLAAPQDSSSSFGAASAAGAGAGAGAGTNSAEACAGACDNETMDVDGVSAVANASEGGRLGQVAETTAPPAKPEAEPEPEPEPEPPGPAKPFDFANAAASIRNLPTKEALRSLMELAWEYLRDLDSFGLFATPVTDLIAPGYSQIISQPMDLSLLRIRLNKKFRSLGEFGADVELMVNNCFTYNRLDPNSEPSAYAKLLQDAWRYVHPSLQAMLDGTFDPEQAQLAEPPTLGIVIVSSDLPPTLGSANPDTQVGRGRPTKRSREIVQQQQQRAVEEEREDQVEMGEGEEEGEGEGEGGGQSQGPSSAPADNQGGEEDDGLPRRKRGRPRKVDQQATATATVAVAVAVEDHAPVAVPVLAVAGASSSAGTNEGPTIRLRLRAPVAEGGSAGAGAGAGAADGTENSSTATVVASATVSAPARSLPRSPAPRQPKAPAGPQIVKSALLGSSEAALDFIRRQTLGPQAAAAAGPGPAASALAALGLDELPSVLASNRLLWALSMLRDPPIQRMLRVFLAGRLARLVSYIVRELPSASINAAAPVVKAPEVSKMVTLPMDEPVAKLVLQLCQLPFDFSDAMPRCDATLVRVQVPLMLAAVVEIKQARTAEATAAALAEKDKDKDKAGSKNPQGGKVTLTMAELRSLVSDVYTQARESIETTAVGALADLADPLPARTELLESVAKWVLQLLN